MAKEKLTKILVTSGAGKTFDAEFYLVNQKTMKEIDDKLDQGDHHAAAEIARQNCKATPEQVSHPMWRCLNHEIKRLISE